MALANTNAANDSGESNVENRKSSLTIGDLYRDYTKYKLDKKDTKNQFISSVINSDSLDSSIIEEIKNFAGEDSKYDHIEVTSNTINSGAVKREVRNAFISLDVKRKNVQKIFQSQYDISSVVDTNKLKKHIDTLEDYDLNNLLHSEFSRIHALEKVFGQKNIPESKDVLNMLHDTGLSTRIQTKIISMPSGSQKDEAIEALANIQYFNFNNCSVDIKVLMELDVLSDVEKKEILNEYVPFLSLEQVQILGLMSDKDVKNYKKNIVKSSDVSKNLNDETIKSIVDSLKDSDIEVSIQELSLQSIRSQDLDILISQGLEKTFSDAVSIAQDGLDSKAIPKNFSQLKLFLSNNSQIRNRLANVEKLIAGSYIEVEVVVGDEKQTHLTKIDTVDISSGGNIGFNFDSYKQNSSSQATYEMTTKGAHQSYDKFISFLLSSQISKAIVYSQTDVDAKVKSGTMNLTDPSSMPKYGDTFELNKKVDEAELEMGKLRIKEARLRKQGKIDEADVIKAQLDKVTAQRDTHQLYNANVIKKRLDDDIDTDGKQYGLEKGTSFYIEQGNKGEVAIFTIDKIDNKGVTLDNHQTLTFNSLFLGFQNTKAKRFAKVSDKETLVSDLGEDKKLKEYWTDYEVDGGKIKHKKNKTEKDYTPVEFLTQGGDNQGEAIKIISIDEKTAEIQYGKIEGDKPEKAEDATQKFKAGPKETLTLAQLSYLIKKDQLGPQDDFTVPDKDESPIEQKTNFLSWLFQAKSIQEIVQGGKIGVEAIQNMLKEGRDNQSSKAALAMFGWMGSELKNDLKSRVQAEEKKQQDEYIDRLKELDSFEATRLIETWLLNKTCPEYKQNAAMIFMYQEYGSLYTKDKKKDGKFLGGLSRLRGTNLWYKALGGTVGDKIWEETKKRAKEDGMPFTEEQAVFMLVKNQCVAGKRRSRVHKEIKGLWPKGIEDEIEKGYKDAKDTRTAKGIANAGFGELEEGTLANFVGWAKKCSERGSGNIEEVYELPIVAIFSGAINNFDQKIIIKMKDMYKEGSENPMIMFDFVSNTSQMEFFCQVVLEICKSLDGPGGEMYKDALGIYGNRGKKGEGVEKEKVRKTRDFFKKKNYGKRLTRALHMLNNDSSGEGKYAREDNIVALEASKNPPNEVLKKYLHHMHSEVAEDFDFTKESYMTDWLKGAGMSGISTQEAIEKGLTPTSSSGVFRHQTVSKVIWGEVMDGIRSVKRSSNLSQQEKITLIVSKYKDTIAGLYRAAGSGDRHLDTLFGKSDLTRRGLKEIGLFEIHKNTKFKGVGYQGVSEASEGSIIYSDLVKRAQLYLESDGPGLEGVDTSQSVFEIVESTQESANDNYYGNNSNQKAA